MSRSTASLGLAVLILGGATFLVARGCAATDEDAIRDLVADAREAVLARDAAALQACLTPDFEALGRDAPGAVAFVLSLVEERLRSGLEAEVVELEVAGDDARAVVEVRLGPWGRGGRILIAASFRRAEAGDWRIATARRLR